MQRHIWCQDQGNLTASRIAEFALATCSQAHRVQGGDVGPQVPKRESTSYLADVCIPVNTLTGCWQLHSASAGQLLFLRTSTNIGRRGFHCCGPATWNAVPVSLCTDNRSSDAFGRALKRHLFSFKCRLPLFALQRLLMWRIINALIILYYYKFT